MPRFVQVAKKSQVPENGVIGVQVEGKRLALVNLNTACSRQMSEPVWDRA